MTLHQRAKIICLLSREVIDRKIDKELAKKKNKKKTGKILGLRRMANEQRRAVKLFGAIRRALAVPCRQLFVQ